MESRFVLPPPAAVLPLAMALADEGGYDYAAIPCAGHMLQLEKPAACVEAAVSFLAAHRIRA